MPETKILILGGGFAGVHTALHLQRLTRRRKDIHITLISRENYLLMTPLLFETASGVLEPRHAVNAIRKMFTAARFIEAAVENLDLNARKVSVRTAHDRTMDISYDHLVLALGGITDIKLIPGSQHARTFKTLSDAISLRNACIDLFEQADAETDPARKAALLRFVIIGAGLVGVELQGELTEFIENIRSAYPHVNKGEPRFDLIEAGPRLLPEMDQSLGEYTARIFKKRGVQIRLSTPVNRLEPGKVHLPDGTIIESFTIVIATGVIGNPLLATLPLQKDKKGRVEVEPTMRSKSRPEIWAAGDCAAIPDPHGHSYPTLAQHALREARTLAKNILAAIDGQPLQPFVYRSQGTLAALGGFKGVGIVKGFKIHGFLAWWVWRTYYLLQMPRLERRLRIIIDWSVALIFKNDVVQLDMTKRT